MSNIYEFGQCTYWMYAWATWIQPYGNLGNARDWANNAAAKGLSVGTTPAVGAIAVLQPGVDGASVYGHVCGVLSFTSTVLTVTEMDWPTGSTDTSPHTHAMAPGISFIYPPGGDALTSADRAEIAAAFVRLGYYLEGNLEFPDTTTYNNWMTNALNQTFDQIVYISRDSNEGQAYWTQIQQAIALAQQFPAFQAQLNQQLTDIKNLISATSTGSADPNTIATIVRQELQKVLQAAANTEGATQ